MREITLPVPPSPFQEYSQELIRQIADAIGVSYEDIGIDLGSPPNEPEDGEDLH